MEIQRKELLEVLNNIKPGLSTNEMIEQSTCFIFEEGEIYTYNDGITISHPFDHSLPSIAVKADPLYKLLSRFNKETFEWEIEDNCLHIKCGKTKAEMIIETKIVIPVIDLPEDWLELPEDFCDRMDFVKMSVGNDTTRPEFMVIEVKKDILTSCDNFRLTKVTMKDSVDTSFLLPGTASHILSKYNPTSYNLDETWIHFINDNDVVFSCRQLGVKYPKLDNLMNIKGIEIKVPKQLKEAISQMEVFVKSDFEQDDYIDIRLDKNKLHCSGKSTIGIIKSFVKIKYTGKEHTFRIKPNHLIDILNHLDILIVGDDSLYFEGDNFHHVVSFLTD